MSREVNVNSIPCRAIDVILHTDNFVHFFEFLAHPTSFAQTVENISHFSFLIKVSLSINDHLVKMTCSIGGDSWGTGD